MFPWSHNPIGFARVHAFTACTTSLLDGGPGAVGLSIHGGTAWAKAPATGQSMAAAPAHEVVPVLRGGAQLSCRAPCLHGVHHPVRAPRRAGDRPQPQPSPRRRARFGARIIDLGQIGGCDGHASGSLAASVRTADGRRRRNVRGPAGRGGDPDPGCVDGANAGGNTALGASRPQPADARLAALPVGEGDDPRRLERRRRAPHVVGPLLQPRRHQLRPLRPAQLVVRAAADGRPDAGVARGPCPHRGRTGEPLSDLLGRRRLADADRRRPAAGELSPGGDAGDSRAAPRPLQPHRVDRERH